MSRVEEMMEKVKTISRLHPAGVVWNDGSAIRDRFEGCVLGLGLGDALGAPLEGGPIERLLWRFIGRTSRGEMRWTDDTQMSLDLAESLVEIGRIDSDDLARRFAAGYRWSRGYGPGTAKLLRRLARGEDWRAANRAFFPRGSFGNGGAMRAPVVGLFYAGRAGELAHAARDSARVTHPHPLGLEGAVLMASATAAAVKGKRGVSLLRAASVNCRMEPFTARIRIACSWLEVRAAPPPRDVRLRLGNGIAATESCVTALYIAARFIDDTYIHMQEFVHACGGDVDTCGAMAGALWGAANGAARLPEDGLSKLEQRDRLRAVAAALYERVRETPDDAPKLRPRAEKNLNCQTT